MALNARQLPNLLSFARLALTPLVYLELSKGHYRNTLLLFVIASFTDTFDGLLARKYGWHSRLGKFVDPLADKLLIDVSFVALSSLGVLSWWLTLLVVGRDVLIVLVALLLLLTGRQRQFEPTFLGKTSTTFQMITVALALARGLWQWNVFNLLLSLSVVFTALLTVASGVQYGWRTFKTG